MNKFMLKIFKWIDGALQSSTHEAVSIAEAIELARHHEAHGFKVFDPSGNLCHSQSHPVGPTYA